MSILEQNNCVPWVQSGAKMGPLGAKIGSTKPQLTFTNCRKARQSYPLEPAMMASSKRLNGHLWIFDRSPKMVGVRGFEPPASRSRT